MHLGLIFSLVVHTTVLLWAILTIQATPPFKMPEQTPVEVAIITADDLVRLRQGDRASKNLDATGSEGTTKIEPKVQPKTPPPPPPPAAAIPPPPPPEPPKDPIADQIAALKEPPKPEPKPEPRTEPPPGPSPEEQKKLDDAIKAEQAKADDAARLKLEAEAAAKAEAEAKAKAAEAERQKKLAEEKRRKDLERQKQLVAAAKKKAEDEAKKKEFNLDDIAKKIDAAPNAESGPKQALEDKSKPKPAAAAGQKAAANAKGPRAGAPEGTDTVLTAGQKDALIGQLRERVQRCWNINAGLQDAARLQPVVEFELNKDGSVRGTPRVANPDPSPQFQDAANSAIRAVLQCQPYALPPDLYANWEYVSLRFDPSKMFR